MDNFSNETSKGCLILLVFIFIDICAIIIGTYYHSKNNNYKDNNTIESSVELQKHNDSLRIEVNNLDSIKNAKVIEVKTLDNDSTIKLFYKLIK